MLCEFVLSIIVANFSHNFIIAYTDFWYTYKILPLLINAAALFMSKVFLISDVKFILFCRHYSFFFMIRWLRKRNFYIPKRNSFLLPRNCDLINLWISIHKKRGKIFSIFLVIRSLCKWIFFHEGGIHSYSYRIVT